MRKQEKIEAVRIIDRSILLLHRFSIGDKDITISEYEILKSDLINLSMQLRNEAYHDN